MDIKIIILILSILGSSLSQSISCSYGFEGTVDKQNYVCYLVIHNPNGWDNFTQVEGTHLPGQDNIYVTAIIRQYVNSTTLNVPQILCSQFVHVTYMDLSYLKIQNVDQSSFRGCKNLSWLRLYSNRISQLSDNLFNYNKHLEYLDLEYNLLSELPENIFYNQMELQTLDLGNNPLNILPNGVFKNLKSLKTLYMRNLQLSAINPAWFENLRNLEILEFANNKLTQQIPPNTFKNLINLWILFMARCDIDELNPLWFRNTSKLEYLFLNENSIFSIPSNTFKNTRELIIIDLGSNNLTEIPGDAFDNLENLSVLSLEDNRIRRLHPQWFKGKPNIDELYFQYNLITSLPSGIFSELNFLTEIDLTSNKIRTINRNAFGSLQLLRYINLDDNEINSIDERFLSDTAVLNNLFLNGNICAGRRFFNFAEHRTDFTRILERCSNNFRFVIDTITEANNSYNFFSGTGPGMRFEVNSDTEISVALTPFDIAWNPMIEIIISNNFTRIIRNQITQVAISPNRIALKPNQWNEFRITWAKNVILVFAERDEYPFLAYTMEDLFSVNFYGLRSHENRASWTVEPIIIPQMSLFSFN